MMRPTAFAKTTVLAGGLLVLGIGARIPDDAPQVLISNGIIRTSLYLPDTARGYYRGTRFDWSGAFGFLDYKGHRFVEPWYDAYDPKIHDAINGPVEEFTPLGFTEAEPGATFVKIGVGALRRPDAKTYSFATYYDVVNYGKRSVRTYADRVVFRHELTDAAGYGYQYTKTVRLTNGKPELVLEHRLKNTGQRRIETSVYNHNFFVIDKQPTGPGVEIRFPFAVTAEGKGFGSTILTEGNKLVYARPLEKREQVFSAGLQGFGPSASDYDVRIENRKTGASVRMTADQPLEKLVFWACATTSCPEPYIRLRAEPGQEVTWKINYTFYENSVP